MMNADQVRLMRRRDFIALLGGTAAAWPLAAPAQQRAPVIGFLSGRSPSESAPLVESFRRGLRQIGLVEDRNVNIVFRWAEGRYSQLSGLAAELVKLQANVIFAAGGAPAAMAAKQATSTIPVVFLASDPVHFRLVTSLNRPGGNVTGISNLATDLPSKSMQFLRQLRPDVKVLAFLVNPTNPSAPTHAQQASEAAKAMGVELHVIGAGTLTEMDKAFSEMARDRIVALGVMADAFLDSQREHVVELSARYGVAGCYPWRDYVTAGGMMSYGTNLAESYRQAAIYVGRIINGEKPAELPVMQPTKIELVLNLKTAAALGITVPPQLLAIADEVIE